MREKVGVKVVKALKRNDDGVKHAAIDMLCALMQVWNAGIYKLKLPKSRSQNLHLQNVKNVTFKVYHIGTFCSISDIFSRYKWF